MVSVIAHRGASGTYPENTMLAFIEAEKCGADGIELDVQLTKDNEIVIIHDTTVDRTTNGAGNVQDYTLEDIRKLKVNKTIRTLFSTSEIIPTLQEVFDWLTTNQLICHIELKNNKIAYTGLEEKVVALIKKYHFQNRVILSTFNENSLIYLQSLAPELEKAILTNKKLSKPWEYAKKLHLNGIHPKFTRITKENIQLTMEQGIAVRPYTVNSTKEMRKLIDIHCSGIITDYPKKAKEVILSMKKQ